MTREELDRRNAAALTRHYRTWTDNAGQAPRGLLDDLARIAQQHAAEYAVSLVTEAAPIKPDAPGSTESHGAVTPAQSPTPGPGARRTASTRAAASGSGRTRRTAK